MSYQAYFANGDNLIIDGVNNETSLIFDENEYLEYGEYYWSNLVYLTEHFSSPYQPVNPIKGQLWYDNNTKQLKLFTNNWNNLIGTTPDLSDYCKKTDIIDYLKAPEPKNNLSIATKKYVEKSVDYAKDNYIMFPNNYVIFYLSTSNTEINLPMAMNINYSVICTCNSIVGIGSKKLVVYDKKETSFKINADIFDTISIIVMGFAL